LRPESRFYPKYNFYNIVPQGTLRTSLWHRTYILGNNFKSFFDTKKFIFINFMRTTWWYIFQIRKCMY
jgi:hypothetical protein